MSLFSLFSKCVHVLESRSCERGLFVPLQRLLENVLLFQWDCGPLDLLILSMWSLASRVKSLIVSQWEWRMSAEADLKCRRAKTWSWLGINSWAFFIWDNIGSLVLLHLTQIYLVRFPQKSTVVLVLELQHCSTWRNLRRVFFSSKNTFVTNHSKRFHDYMGRGPVLWLPLVLFFFLREGMVLSLCIPEDDRVDDTIINY